MDPSPLIQPLVEDLGQTIRRTHALDLGWLNTRNTDLWLIPSSAAIFAFDNPPDAKPADVCLLRPRSWGSALVFPFPLGPGYALTLALEHDLALELSDGAESRGKPGWGFYVTGAGPSGA